MPDQEHAENNCPSLERLRVGPPTVSVDVAATYLGVSRGFAYQMVKAGRLPVIRLSTTRMRVPTAKLLRLLGCDDESVRPAGE